MRRNPLFLPYMALAAVCFFWGTTYLGIRMALESFPPFVLMAVRFTLSGSILLLVAWLKGLYLPRGKELWRTALFGVITLGCGTGALVVAEQWIPSGLASLFVTLSPFWMIAAEALIPGGDKPTRAALGGMLVGFIGVALLLQPENASGVSTAVINGFLILQLGCAAWAVGSILQRRLSTKANPIISGAVQQLAAGLAYVPLALFSPASDIHISPRGVGAILYLVTFGSIVGYSAFIYAMEKLPVPIVSIYTYVNPVVAIFLGWLIYRENFSPREAVGMVVIFVGVALVKRYGQRKAVPAPPPLLRSAPEKPRAEKAASH